jgi:hypothetical protein
MPNVHKIDVTATETYFQTEKMNFGFYRQNKGNRFGLLKVAQAVKCLE